MKKIASIVLALAMLAAILAGCSAADDGKYTIGVCQLMVHESLDKATQGFIDALKAQMDAAESCRMVQGNSGGFGEVHSASSVLNIQ